MAMATYKGHGKGWCGLFFHSTVTVSLFLALPAIAAQENSNLRQLFQEKLPAQNPWG
jgi:hypothetical protein